MKEQAPSGRVRRAGSVVALVIVFCAGDAAWATGFFVNQQSVRGLGRVDAGNTAAADELGTIFFNPAGLTQVFARSDDQTAERWRASIGVELIIPRATVNNTGSTIASLGTGYAPVPYGGGNLKNPTDPTPVPNMYFAYKLSPQAAVGIGFNGPFGLATRSADDWFGRYDAIKASLLTSNVSVVGAYAIQPNFSIGGGFDLQYARTDLITAVPNPLVPGGPTAATDLRAETTGHAWTPGFNVGMLYTFDDGTRFGLHYRSRMNHDIKGSITISGLPTDNVVTGARADVKLPAIATAGLWRKVRDDLALMAELEWYHWSTFDRIVTRFDDGTPDVTRETRYRNTWALAVGAEYQRMGSPWSVRGGIQFDQTPTVNGFRDTTVPDSDRLWLGLGASYDLSSRQHLDFAFNHVFFRHTNVDVTRTFDIPGHPELPPTTNHITGSARTVVNTIAVDFRWAF